MSSSGELRQLRCRIRVANRRMSIARLHRKTLCYSKSLEMLRYSIRLLLHYLKFKTVTAIALNITHSATPKLKAVHRTSAFLKEYSYKKRLDV